MRSDRGRWHVHEPIHYACSLIEFGSSSVLEDQALDSPHTRHRVQHSSYSTHASHRARRLTHFKLTTRVISLCKPNTDYLNHPQFHTTHTLISNYSRSFPFHARTTYTTNTQRIVTHTHFTTDTHTSLTQVAHVHHFRDLWIIWPMQGFIRLYRLSGVTGQLTLVTFPQTYFQT